MLSIADLYSATWSSMIQSMRYARGLDAVTAVRRAITRVRSYCRGNSDIAMDGAGVKPSPSLERSGDNV